MFQLLITGGAGFIGSHAALVLLEAGHSLVVLDNFANSSPESLRRVLELAGPDSSGRLTVVKGDIRNPADLDQAFAAAPAGQPIDAVINFAGLRAAVGESLQHPLRYWDVNLGGTRQLLAAVQSHGCRTLGPPSSACPSRCRSQKKPQSNRKTPTSFRSSAGTGPPPIAAASATTSM